MQASAPGVALVTTSLQRVVTVALEASKQSEARVGEAVQVTLPSSEVVAGHIAAVAGAATTTPSSSSGGSSGSTASTVNVEITIDKRLANAGLDQAPVSVAFAAQRENSVLSIPVTALVATAGGGYAVEEVRGTARTLVSVTPGLYAGGYVAITGVPEGTVVTNASQ
jgi:membrane fusion protein, multidrug efflux system